MTAQEQLPLHKKALPYLLLILGLFIGLALAIDWDIKLNHETDKSIWGIVSSVGSLLAGLGTVGLLVFGWVKSNEWIKQLRTQAKIDLTIKTAEKFANEASSLSLFINIHTSGKSQQDLYLDGDDTGIGECSLSETSSLTTNDFLQSIRKKSADIDLLFSALHPILKKDPDYKDKLNSWREESRSLSTSRKQLENQLSNREELNFSKLKDNAFWFGADARAIFTICLTKELQL